MLVTLARGDVTLLQCHNHQSLVGKKNLYTENLNFLISQLDAQNSCLFTYNTFIKILYMFQALSMLIFRRSTS